MRSRLDPAHHGTGRVLSTYEELLSRIDPAKVLVPSDAEWLAAGELAGGGGKIATAFDRVELISDTLTAILGSRPAAGGCHRASAFGFAAADGHRAWWAMATIRTKSSYIAYQERCWPGHTLVLNS